MKFVDQLFMRRISILVLFLSLVLGLFGCKTTSEYVGDPYRYESPAAAQQAIEEGLQSASIVLEEDIFKIQNVGATSSEVSWTEIRPTGMIGYMTKNPLFNKVERVSFQYRDLDLKRIRVRESGSESRLVLPVTHYIRQGLKVRTPITFKFEECEEASRIADALTALCKTGKL